MRLRAFARNRLALLGLGIVITLALFSFVGPLFYHTNQVSTDIMQVHLRPGGGHPLGTDELGYDELGRLMAGGQTSIEIGVTAGLLAALIGTLWGTVAGSAGGWVDAAMMRVVDSMLAIPALLLLMVVATIVRTDTIILIGVFAVIAWLGSARLVRAETLTIRVRLYAQAVRVMGGGPVRIIARHVIPNAIGTIVVYTTFLIGDAVLYVSYLSFLGLGIPPPATSWGAMLSNGVTYTFDGYWWLIYPPGVAIVLLVVAFNMIGDGLRDAFEVRLRR